MEIIEVIKPKTNVKEFMEEKLKKEIKEVTPYKKPLVLLHPISRGSVDNSSTHGMFMDVG